VACCSLSDMTSSGVVGVIFSTNSLISYLYSSIVCIIFFIFSSMLISPASVLYRIIWKTSSSIFSNLSMWCFSSSCSNLTSVRTVSNTSLLPWLSPGFVHLSMDLDWTLCYAMLIYNLYIFYFILSSLE
jgi:hypothetical protein